MIATVEPSKKTQQSSPWVGISEEIDYADVHCAFPPQGLFSSGKIATKQLGSLPCLSPNSLPSDVRLIVTTNT